MFRLGNLIVSVFFSAMILLLAGGCVPPVNQVHGNGEIDSITLLANPPVALNLDGLPGNDGVRMYLFCESDAKPASANGVLEMLLYEYTDRSAMVHPAELLTSAPRATWTYSAEKLISKGTREMYDIWGYRIGLIWDANTAPRTKRIVVIAKYTCPSGKIVLSAPANFSMGGE